jgi:hypothetical protein
VLAAPPVVELLQRGFVNAWVLAKDLDAIAARAGAGDVAKVCELVQANYGYPVDSVLLGADLAVHGHVNVHDAAGHDPRAYLAFLRRGLAAAGRLAPDATAPAAARAAPKRGAAAPKPLVVTPAAPAASLLDAFRARGFGEPSMAFVTVDATAFADGGVLELEVRVGSGAAAGRFEICAPVADDPETGAPAPRAMRPVATLPSVARETTATLRHEFAKGGRFGLAIMPATGTEEGDGNAFVATVTVRAR